MERGRRSCGGGHSFATGQRLSVIVVFDSTTLLLAMYPDIETVNDPETGNPLDRPRERVEHLIESLDADGATIVIPTPVLAEVLMRAGAAASDILSILDRRAVFQISDFDQMAAVETAAMLDDARRRGGLKVDAVLANVTRSKVKFDRQIMAVAKVQRASRIYSDDGDIHKLAQMSGIEVISTADLPLPPEDPQTQMDI